MNSISQKTLNYILLKKDEHKVFASFKECFEEIVNVFQHQLDIIQYNKNVKDIEDLFENSLKMEKTILMNIKDIQDECIWLIQKHEPRASHLRFLIAIINSLNDLKRISNYIVSYCKFFSKYYGQISNEMKQIMIDISSLCINKTRDYISLLNDEEDINQDKNANKIFDNFLEQYKKQYLNFINQTTIETNDSSIKATSVILIKNIDRTIDHCMNIIENFSSINN